MGIKGLFYFLKKYEKEVYIPHYITGQSVGIDIFWFIHKSKGDMFLFHTYLLPIIKHAKRVYCVFDGTAPPEKQEVLKERAEKRQEIQAQIDEMEKYIKYPFNQLSKEEKHNVHEYIKELKLEAWHPTYEYIRAVKQWLRDKGCEICQAPGEADDYLVDLDKIGAIQTIISNDSDLILLGGSNILKIYSPSRAGVYNKNNICDHLGFTAQQWTDFMSLCIYMKEKDINLAYSFIKVYKDLDYVVQKYHSLYKNYLVTDKFFEDHLDIDCE